jgi:propanol-preferring alcohol dehydrogenase
MLRVVSRLLPTVSSASVARTAMLAASAAVQASGGAARLLSVKSQASYDVPKTQTAVVVEQFDKPLAIHTDWPVVQPEELLPGQVLVRLAYTGVCHSDYIIWKGEVPWTKPLPLVGGHEGAGYVAAIGKHSRTALKVGDPVGIKFIGESCMGCEDCRSGHEEVCEHVQNHGMRIDGSFQQWCVGYAEHLAPIPKNLPLHLAAPLLCAGVTSYTAIKRIGGAPGQTVVVHGAGGGLGHLAVQYARNLGYRVIAIDTGADKDALVKKYGAHEYLDFKDGHLEERVKALTGGRGAHAVAVIAGANQAYQDALPFLRPYGVLVAVGVPMDGVIHANVSNLLSNGLRIIGSYVGNRQDTVDTLNVSALGDVTPEVTLGKLTDLPSVYERMEAGQLNGRAVLDCS